MTSVEREGGFTLIEVVVSVGLIAIVCVTALALVPSLVHASQRYVMRDAAVAAARLELERVRIATAYYPSSGPTADHTYALNPATTFTTNVRVHRALCGTAQPTTDVPITIADTYTAADDTLAVTVTYPPDPCVPQATTQLTLSGRIPPSLTAPGTTVSVPIGDPAVQ